jgi:hypothetical protein
MRRFAPSASPICRPLVMILLKKRVIHDFVEKRFRAILKDCESLRSDRLRRFAEL